MRDEDLAKLPQSIEAWKVREFLEGLGIKHEDVFDTHFGVRSVEIWMYASDAEGRRFLATSPGEGAAQQYISIPYVGGWDKPKDPALDVQCAVRRNLGPAGRCSRFGGHTGEHDYPDRVESA